jgi:CrcB protein
MAFAVVFLGSGLGGALRHGVNEACAALFGTKFPYGILLINITGSLLLGLLAGYFAFKGEANQHWRLLLATGVCGGYTTFSTFSLDAVTLWQRGDTGLAALYVVASVALSLLALASGMWAMKSLL